MSAGGPADSPVVEGHGLRVLMIGPFPRDRTRPGGGVESVTSNLIHGMAALSGPEFQVITPCLGLDRMRRETLANGDVTFVPLRPGLAGWRRDLHGRLMAEARRRDVDLVHVQAAASVAARMPGALLTVHGSAERDAFRTHVGPGRYLRAGTLLALEGAPRRAARRAIVTSTRATTPEIDGGSVRSWRWRRAWNIPNPIDPIFYGPASDTGRGDPTLFLCLGRITPLKDVAGAIRAFGPVAATSSAGLLVAGDGLDTAYGRFCQDLVSNLGLRRSVTFLGGQTVRQSAALLREVGTLVLFSRQENAPMVVAEALAAGPAVVATSVGEVPELLRGLPGCHLVPVADEAALTDRLLASCVAEPAEAAGRRRLWAQRFRPETVAAQTLAVYTELLSGRATAARGIAQHQESP